MKKVIWGFIGFLLLLFAGLTLLLTTETGLYVAIKGINRFTGVHITADKLSGTIMSTLRASSLTVDTPGSNWIAKNTAIRYNIFALIEWRVSFHSLSAESLSGTFHADTKDPTGKGSPAIAIKHAEIDQLTLHLNSNWQPIRAKQVQWNGLISQNQIKVTLTTGAVNNALESLSLTVNGQPTHYQILLRAQSTNQSLFAMGSGTDKGVKLRIIPKYLKKSYIKGNVALQWGQGLNWEATISAGQLNTSSFLSNGPVIHDLGLSTQGQIGHDTTRVKWRLNAKTSAGTIRTTGAIDGQHTKANWTIKNAALHNFLPEIHGLLNTQGSFTDGESKGKLSLLHARWQQYQVQRCAANWDATVKNKHIHALSLHCTNATNGSLTVPKLTLSAHQTKHKNLQLNVTLNSQQAWLSSLSLSATVPQLLLGTTTLNNLTFISANEHFRLKQPVIFNYHDIITQDKPVCMIAKHSSFCLNSAYNNNQYQLTMTGKQIPIGQLLTAAEPNPNYTIGLNASFTAKLLKKDGEKPTATLNLNANNSHLIVRQLGIRSRIPLRTFHIKANLTGEKLQFDASSQWGKGSHYQMAASIDRPDQSSESWLTENLTGQANVHIQRANFFNSFSSLLAIQSGSLNSDVTLRGSINKPVITGKLALTHGKVKIIPTQVVISQISSQITANQHAIHFKLAGRTSGTPFQLTGTSDYNRVGQPMNTRFRFSSKNLLVANTAELTANISPSLHGTIIGKKLSVGGSIDVLSATVRPISFSSATTLPGETVILGKEKEKRWKTALKLKIRLGKKVVVTSDQLNAKLYGQLSLLKKFNSGIVANGNIHVKSGTFKAYGLNLTIASDSMLSYQENPLSMPSIHAKIYRKINTGGFDSNAVTDTTHMIVGIEANGPYANMAVTLYSSPIQLDQATILSYLVLGHPGTTNTMNLASLLATVGTLSSDNLGSGINKILSIKKTLGFSELGVQSNLTLDALGTPYGNDESGFVVGRYITPHIYVRYVRGISALMNLFQVQYRLNSHWSVQVESGNIANTDVEGADIIYRFTDFSLKKKK